MTLREWWARLRRRAPEDLQEEIEGHFLLAREEHEARGMNREEAERAAARLVGNRTLLAENARDAWTFPRWESWLQDVRFAARWFRRSPGFAAAVILTLALGIGVNTAIFSVVYAVLLRPLPYPASERLVWLGESTGKVSGISVTWLNFEHWRAENHSFEKMAAFQGTELTLTGRGEPVITQDGAVTSGFLELIGARPLFGRVFITGDEKRGAVPVVILGYEFWNRRFAANPAILGATLDLNGTPYQVIGVLGPGPAFRDQPFDLFLPLGPSEDRVNRGRHGSIRALGRLKAGVTLAAARSDLNVIMRRLDLSDPSTEKGFRVYAEPLLETRTGEIRPTLLLLMAAVLLVLLLACANISNLLLARSTERIRELAIRMAIGAGRARVARQLFTETVLLTICGGTAGVALAAGFLSVLHHAAPPEIPRLAEVSLHFPVLLFALIACILTGLMAGFAPVRSSRKLEITNALKEGSTGAGNGPFRQRLGNLLVICEVAITLVLAFASGLLIRSLLIAQTAYPGFDPNHILALQLQLPAAYKGSETVRRFYARLQEKLVHEPGVEAVGAVYSPPSAGDNGDWWYSIPGKPVPDGEDVPLTLTNIADAGYFDAMRIPLKAGRTFDETDLSNALPVAIINETIARRWWRKPGDAIGQQVKLGGPYREGPQLQIVGVAGDVSQLGLDTAPMPEVYRPFAQTPSSSMVVLIRTHGKPDELAGAARRDVSALDRNLPIQSLKPFREWLAAPLAKRRFTALLLGIFAALAFALAGIGIYGVLNYWIHAREREIAIRLALGAQRGAVLSWAGMHIGRLFAAGIVIGIFGSWSAAHWLSNLLFQVSPYSPQMMTFAFLTIVMLAGAAAAVPLSRAMRASVARNLHDS